MPGSRADGERNSPHIDVSERKDDTAYTPVSRTVRPKPKRDDYVAHASRLIAELNAALSACPPRPAAEVPEGVIPGALVEVETVPPGQTARQVPDLDFKSRGIRVLQTQRTEDGGDVGVVFVPDSSRDFLQSRISGYGSENLGNRARPDVARFEVIEAIRPADAESLFIGKEPFETEEAVWWELWVLRPERGERDTLLPAARRYDVAIHPSRLRFPEIDIVFAHATTRQLRSVVADGSGKIAEIRRAHATPEIILDDGRSVAQSDWVDDLLARLIPPSETAPAICVHDTGVAAAHPLIAPGLKHALTHNEKWGTDDHHPRGGHGTSMVGVALHGDLFFPLQSGEEHRLTHWVESVKTLPPDGFDANEPADYGSITHAVVSNIEIAAPARERAHCLAITDEFFDPSQPSSWSGAIDQACAGTMLGEEEGSPRRLFLIASGNTIDAGKKEDVLKLQGIEDPAQSWNALTIGGYTTKDEVNPPLTPAVKANERSPYGRGTVCFDKSVTPFKPEVVFEAGNMAVSSSGDCMSHEALSLITTGSSPIDEPLVSFWATSAATAMAANFMGKLMAGAPGLWPETYRALTVHSADWTPPMRRKLKTFSNKAVNHPLLREFGFGVPDLQRALYSAKNDVTLFVQTEIQPFALSEDGGRAVFNEIHYYRLPWPIRVLQELGDKTVILRVTLSYLPDVNLSPRAATRPESYRAFGLRFKLKGPKETHEDFRKRVNDSERERGEKLDGDGQSGRWLVGPRAVSAGSLHSDMWRGPAVDLAAMDMIAVSPVTGWWKTHMGQQKTEAKGRYCLLVSIDAREHDCDLYSEISTPITPEIEI